MQSEFYIIEVRAAAYRVAQKLEADFPDTCPVQTSEWLLREIEISGYQGNARLWGDVWAYFMERDVIAEGPTFSVILDDEAFARTRLGKKIPCFGKATDLDAGIRRLEIALKLLKAASPDSEGHRKVALELDRGVAKGDRNDREAIAALVTIATRYGYPPDRMDDCNDLDELIPF